MPATMHVCRQLQAGSLCSPRKGFAPVHVCEFGGSFPLHEGSYCNQLCAHDFAPRANTSARYLQRQTSIHLRRHDEAQTRRRTGAVAGWEMGRVRLRRCRSRGEHQNFAFVDRAGEWWRIAPLEPDAKSRRTAAFFARWKAAHLDLESDRFDANLDV